MTMTEPNDHCMRSEFDDAIEKVFRVMDIFSKGIISEANVNKWVPEPALYFLGSVFQKIRNSRMPMPKDQFFEDCVKIFRKSADADIK